MNNQNGQCIKGVEAEDKMQIEDIAEIVARAIQVTVAWIGSTRDTHPFQTPTRAPARGRPYHDTVTNASRRHGRGAH